MRRCVMGAQLVLADLLPTAVLQAATPENAQVEINYLLADIADSGCTFYRNGTWYDAKGAQEHLKYKYERLRARDLVSSAEDFIDRGATRSSMSNLAYAIRCPGAGEVPAAQWLREQLASYRSRR